jgi:hypothetical protein
LPADGTITDVKAYLAGGGTSPQAFRAVIYAMSGTTPGALKAVGPEVTVAPDHAPGWVTFPITGVLSAGNYLVGVWDGATGGGAQFYYDDGGSADGHFIYSPYSTTAAPPDPWGADSTEPRLWSIYADYTPTPPAAPVTYQSGAAFNAYGTGDSQSITVPSGTNQVLVFTFAGKTGADSLTSVSYAGRPLSLLAARGQQSARVELWYLVAPPAGTANLVWTKSGASQNCLWGVAVYSGVNQTAPFGPPAQTGATQDSTGGAKTLTVASAAGEVVVDGVVFNAGPASGGPVAGSGQTVRWSRNQSTTQGGSSSAPGASATVLSWSPTGSPNYDWALVAAALKPASP